MEVLKFRETDGIEGAVAGRVERVTEWTSDEKVTYWKMHIAYMGGTAGVVLPDRVTYQRCKALEKSLVLATCRVEIDKKDTAKLVFVDVVKK